MTGVSQEPWTLADSTRNSRQFTAKNSRLPTIRFRSVTRPEMRRYAATQTKTRSATAMSAYGSSSAPNSSRNRASLTALPVTKLPMTRNRYAKRRRPRSSSPARRSRTRSKRRSIGGLGPQAGAGRPSVADPAASRACWGPPKASKICATRQGADDRTAAQGAFPSSRTPRERGLHLVDDVRLLVPRDDRVHHAQAGDALEVHRGSGRRQSPAGAVRLRARRRLRHAGLLDGLQQAAQAVGAADHAGRAGRRPGGLLVLVPDRVRLGVHRFLLLRADPGHPGHQPVLDAGQHHLRPAAGEADLRVH